ncbi:spore germination protein [Anaerobacillus sp. MEB173]|uniref:spore germination protein n=1 Tax=Anaerobacillus sp. MEB173 TaxID=3383345 RepID=UPI003F9085E1
MFKKLLKKLNENKVRKTKEYHLELSTELTKTVESIKNIVGESDDIIQRDFMIAKQVNATIFFIDGLNNQDRIEGEIVRPLLYFTKEEVAELKDDKQLLEKWLNKNVLVSDYKVYETFDEAILPFMSGESLLVIDGIAKLIVFETRRFEQRGIDEPQSEVVIRGPRDGFIETMLVNVALMRRRLRDPNLIVQFGSLGQRSKKDFALLYLKGVVNQDLVDEIRYRISCIDVDHVAETGTIEQLIEDNVLSPFPQMLQTERPDKAVGHITNGHVIVVVDGTPFVLIAPITFQQLFKSPEDYYDRWHIGTLIRVLRYLAAFIALFLPALYIAMVSYHQGMIPTTLALSIAGSREGVPFPAFVEALMMEFTLELLREAGIRLPRPVGSTIGIVGGLVIGDAAVRAGIVSPIMVIVVAITAIASFAIPSYNVSITLRVLRFMLMISAAIFGLFGIVVIYILINIHLVGLRSFGSYYTSPFAPYRFADWVDMVIRAPLSVHKMRTDEPRTIDDKRQG